MNSKNDRKSIRWIVAAALAVVLCVCICFGVACKKTNKDAQGDAGYFTKTDPGDKKPEAGYSGNEYVNYVAYVLEQQTEWYAVSDSQAKASVNNQQIWTDKYYKDGYMLTTQKSYSSFSKEAFEALFVTGRQGSAEDERGVYLRDGSKPKNKDHDFSDVEWEDTPTYYLEEDYYFLHGLFSDEMSVFVINDQTIERADAVVKNNDGTYSQHFVLDTDDSVYYYQYSMKNHGGLSSFPTFEKVEVTMTFNESFELLKLETTEQSKVRKAGSNWTNKTTATTTYTYPDMKDEENFNGEDIATIWSENSETLDEAKTYFDQYYGKLEPTTDREIVYTPDAGDVLIGAIGDALTSEGETYGMYINYNDEVDASGYIYVAVDLENWDDISFDFSEFATMDWVTFALEAYQYAHIIVEVDDDNGEQALIVDFLSGSNILEILSGKLVEVYIGEGALGSVTEEEIIDGVATGLDEILTAMYMAMAQALDEEEEVEEDEGMSMTLEYGDAIGTNHAKVSLVMDGFELYLDCDVTKSVGEEGNTYEYALVEMTMSIPSINLDIVLKPVSGDKMSYVTPNETTAETESSVGSLGLETLVMDLINSVLDLSSSSYIKESYTFSGDISIGITSLRFNIDIKDCVITIGDVLDDFYISFVGDLQGCTYLGMKMATVSTIGFTWYGDCIVIAKNLETQNPSYRMYTTSSFVDTMLNSDTRVSPLAWLLGTGDSAWSTLSGVFNMFLEAPAVLNEIATIDDGDANETQSILDWLNIGYYVSAMEVKLNGVTGASVGDIDVGEVFGLTDDYWAFVLGNDFIDDITNGILNSATVAITQKMSQIDGIYVTGKIYNALDISLSLNYETNLSGAYDLFGGSLVLAVTEEQAVIGEDGTETTETVVVGINTQLVPNLYDVFVEGLGECGLDEEDLDYAPVTNQQMVILYSTSSGTYIVTITLCEGSATTNGTWTFYEYTVGDDTYKAYYHHEAVTGTDKDNESKEFDAGYGYIEYELPDYPTDGSGEGVD